MTEPAYYNEFDKPTAQWLRNLIAAGHIAPGHVDDRDLRDIKPSDLRGYAQCHFFAGVGVWSLALRRAGWPDSCPVWTASCPCQPFSAAGRGDGFDDERHLWPAFYQLVAQLRPGVVFGEQVASKDAAPWLDAVQDDLEGVDYAFGAVAFPSAGVGAPHVRDRLYWVADAQRPRVWGQPRGEHCMQTGPRHREHLHDPLSSGDVGRLEHARHHHDTGEVTTPSAGQSQTHRSTNQLGGSSLSSCELGNTERAGLALGQRIAGVPSGAGGANEGEAVERTGVHAGGLADCGRQRRVGRKGVPAGGVDDGAHAGRIESDDGFICGSEAGSVTRPTGPTNGYWADADWLFCRDGKWRPVEPGAFPLAHGAPARVGRLRAYGNAINAQQAQIFIEAFLK